ncbi:hypothetical protein H2203_007287 [Taxawa tesnikishii (nom. ined.)]|nr:hypothetical protein H2203_007287 [Dothideales sp. JES 119]
MLIVVGITVGAVESVVFQWGGWACWAALKYEGWAGVDVGSVLESEAEEVVKMEVKEEREEEMEEEEEEEVVIEVLKAEVDVVRGLMAYEVRHIPSS